MDQKLFPYLKKFETDAESADIIEYKIGEIYSELKNKKELGGVEKIRQTFLAFQKYLYHRSVS